MAEIVTSLVVQKLAEVPLLTENKMMLRGVRDDFEHIRGDLVMLLDALKEADQRQSSDQAAKVWVNQVRDVVYETEDVMEELVTHFGQSPAKGYSGRWLVTRFGQSPAKEYIGRYYGRVARFPYLIATWYSIADRIHRIKQRIRDISEREHQLSLALSSKHWTGDERMFPFGVGLENAKLVGMKQPMKQLTERLLGGDPRLEVIAVVGMGGIGKTTLARKVYDDYSVRSHFECCAWITVTEPFETTELLRYIMKQFKSGWEESSSIQKQKSSTGELAEELRSFLMGKRYVAFLDDLWTADTWKFVKSVFPDNEFRSRIVVTTRSLNVASYCAIPVANILRLEPLTKEEAWALFCNKAFSHDDQCPPELENISRKILMKCAGLPLAIAAVGGLLSKKDRTPGEWEMVNRRLVSELDGSHVMKVLSLSYDHLPYHLKPCFLYLGIYPSSYEIKRTEISRQWVAEGFIVPLRDTHSTLEDVSESNLSELAERSLLGKTKVDCFGRVESFQVHDLVREFILWKSREQSFLTWSGFGGDARRLAIHSGQNFEGDAHNPSQFRSLFLFSQNVTPSLAKFNSLKVLVLKGVKLDVFSSSILDLIHLRYLCLRRTKIEKVPNSIKKLQNLQTLDLKYTLVSKLPHQIIQLRSLRHLLAGDANGPRGAKLPGKLGNLRSMHTLRFLDVGDGGEQLKELGKLTQLRRLSITSLRKEDGMELCSSIQNMVHLQSLAVTSVGGDKLLDIDSLSTPPINLRNIKLTGHLVKLPRHLLSLHSIVKLKLLHSQLKVDLFQALQYSLPCLTDLRMFDEAYAGEKLEAGSKGFPSLKMLQIGSFHMLELITLEEGTMPNLQFLAIRGCKELRRIPLGIEYLYSLTEIHLPPELLGIVLEKNILNKEKKVSEEKISEMEKEVLEEQVDEWQKLKHIPVIRQNFCVDGKWYSTSVD